MGHILYIEEGILYSSGDNQYGQLGVGNVKDTAETYRVITGIPQYDAIPWIEAKVGANHSVALKQDKSIWMWGSNVEGQMALPAETLYLTIPTKINFPINTSKNIDINIGLYFTLISQTSEKTYGVGTFQNLGSDFVETYRQITPLSYQDPEGELFLTVDTGPKTIIARISSGVQVYTDWSGDLVPREFTTFGRLAIGDYFTLYDPFNRDRLLYKKVDTYQIALGCCPVNALCMHRKYKELLSEVEATYPSIDTFTLGDLLSENRPNVLSAQEQYGTSFAFNSALAGIDYLGPSYPDKLDPFTLKGMMLATNKRNLLDIILFGGLHFTDDPADELNIDTAIEKINAREVFAKSSFPQYFEDISEYRLLPGDAFNLHGIDLGNGGSITSPDNPVPVNTYFRSSPLYFFRVNDKKEPIKYSTANRFWLYQGFAETFNVLENNIFDLFMAPGKGFFYTKANPNDSTDPQIVYQTVNWPVDTNNRVIIEDLFLTEPYLIKYELSQGASSFAQNFVDPYIRIRTQQPEDPIPTCNGWNKEPPIDSVLTEWLYACYVVVDAFAASGRRYITYNVGPYAKQLIEYFLDSQTDPELTKQFFGITKIELEELYQAIITGIPDQDGVGHIPNAPQTVRYEKITGDSFRLLRDIFNTQLQGKIYFDAKTNRPLLRTSTSTKSSDGYVKIFNPVRNYISNRGGSISIVDSGHHIYIPTDRIVCYTYFSRELVPTINNQFKYEYKPDRRTLIVPYNVTGKILPGAVKVSYWLRSPKPDPTKQEIDNIYQQTATFNATNVVYDPKLNITKITLDRPMSANYLIGCVRVPSNFGPVCGPKLDLQIYYNNTFSILEALQDDTSILQ